MKTGPLVLSFRVCPATDRYDVEVSFVGITPMGGRDDCPACLWERATEEEMRDIDYTKGLCDGHAMADSIEGQGAQYFLESFDIVSMRTRDGTIRIYGRAEWIDEDEDFEMEKWEFEPVKEATNG